LLFCRGILTGRLADGFFIIVLDRGFAEGLFHLNFAEGFFYCCFAEGFYVCCFCKRVLEGCFAEGFFHCRFAEGFCTKFAKGFFHLCLAEGFFHCCFARVLQMGFCFVVLGFGGPFIRGVFILLFCIGDLQRGFSFKFCRGVFLLLFSRGILCLLFLQKSFGGPLFRGFFH